MDLVDHFSQFRASLLKDALEGCQDYAKAVPTGKPDLYPTIATYINKLRHDIASAVETGDVDGYATGLGRYQFAMIALFEKMVSETLFDSTNITPKDVLGLAETNGWNWVKFCKKSIAIPFRIEKTQKDITLVVVPRYSEEFRSAWGRRGAPVFDANEMGEIMKRKDALFSDHMIESKLDLPPCKLADGLFHNVALINKDGINRDWTLPLSYG